MGIAKSSIKMDEDIRKLLDRNLGEVRKLRESSAKDRENLRELSDIRKEVEHLREVSNDILKRVECIRAERDDLREDENHARSINLRLDTQNMTVHRLLSQAQACLDTPIVNMPAAPSSPITPLIRSIWPSSTAHSGLLKPVETAWQKGDTQQALSLLDVILDLLTPEILTSSQRVEATLLQAAIMNYSGRSDKALSQVEAALKIAEEQQMNDDLVSKAQLIRGHCCVDLKKYDDARMYFAASQQLRIRVESNAN
ncbi:hypothetical protein MMC07_001814 [Pseudocyphellaria aurata]|nr:hypothetical protein [Pseudocyphellaria aurata]